MGRHHRLAPILMPLVLLLFNAGPLPAAAKEGEGEALRLLKTIQSARSAESGAVSVRKTEIQIGPATLAIEEGVLLPAAPVNGLTLEAAFAGEATLRLATTDPVEAQQLELFTGGRTLLTEVTHAAIVAGNDAVLKKLIAGGEAAPAESVRETAAFFKSWIEGPERVGFAADLAMVKSLMGDPLYDGYFALWCRTQDHGDFYYVVDPSQREPLAVGQFVPFDMSGLDVWQQRSIKNFLRSFKVFGRFADFSAEHPGRWDTWHAASLQPGEVVPPEPEHYVIDLYVNPAIELDAKATARIRIRGGSAAVRTIRFVLTAGVRVTGVFGPENVPLDFVRREGALHVFLARPLAPEETLEIRVEYEGDLVEPLQRDTSYALRDTSSWYPLTGQVGRATYDVTLRRPKKFGMVASGRVVESGEERAVAWERRRLDVAAFGFTFEIGIFDIVRDKIGHVDLVVGFQGDELSPDDRARMIETVKKSLAFFEENFGPYPLDYLNIANVDRGFSQGNLSMVTIATSELEGTEDLEGSERMRQRVAEQSMMTIAHELSHQWWGNWVGWASYRDQWLSEALASYAALVYGAKTAESAPAFLARNALDWRDNLLGYVGSEGRTIASLGSVTLGLRLNSSKSGRAYIPIVYDKGAVVFRMLARMLGEDKFTQMLGTLAKAVANRVIDTPTFVSALERMSGQDLQPFARQFIYGTGVPDVYYRYAVEPAAEAGKWVIRGTAHQIASRIERSKIVKDPQGRWRLEREVKVDVDVPTSTLVVPFQVIVTPPEEVHKGKQGTVQRASGYGGRLVMQGRETPFLYTVPKKPERFELDQLGEVLASFHDEDWAPKRTMRFKAMDLEATGDFAGAEKILRQALDAPIHSERAKAWLKVDDKTTAEERKELEAFENARIRTILARFLLDRGDLDGAEREIVAAEGLLEKPDEEAGWSMRAILRGRLDLARGDAEAAYLRLRKGRYEWWLGPEGFALLAAAASETGHERLAREATERAETGGVDVRALRPTSATAR